jgi:hypothetical protein
VSLLDCSDSASSISDDKKAGECRVQCDQRREFVAVYTHSTISPLNLGNGIVGSCILADVLADDDLPKPLDRIICRRIRIPLQFARHFFRQGFLQTIRLF